MAAYHGIHVACALLLKSNHLVLQGLFDAAYFNAVFGNVYDQRDELLRTALLLKPGGRTLSSILVNSQHDLSFLCVQLFVTLGCCRDH